MNRGASAASSTRYISTYRRPSIDSPIESQQVVRRCSLRVLSARALHDLRCDLVHSACGCGHAGVRTKCRLCVEVDLRTSPAARRTRSRR